MSVAIKTDIADISGSAIEYRLIAASEHGRPTLVFMHEGLGCAALWKDFPDQLCQMTGSPGLVYSRLGYGSSGPCDLPRPLDYMQHEATEMLPQILAHFEIENFALVGHSDGASISLIYAGAAKLPAPRAVIAMAPHVYCEDISVQGIRFAKRAYDQADLKTKLEKFHGMNTETAFRGWNDAWLDPAFRSWNIENYLPAISVPVFVIQGLDDNYGTLAQIETIESATGGSFQKLLLAGCGHSPWSEKRDMVLGASVPFLRDIS
ncbi:alpha/beta hydrolase [Sneathiella marina]|uniref:Alpha/beta hydrolase n=1 Tax=Sneathiella marina TaxID=2950108 RepID=A0ABY4W0Q1_9PROT|nr:alpha/beta hydrolase [Sneathiella marina]USG60534.1 alpha/beta hydrolase [Sneathiella marina]